MKHIAHTEVAYPKFILFPFRAVDIECDTKSFKLTFLEI